MMKKITLLLGFVCALGYSQYIADANFEAYLETHDANGNVVPVGDPTSLGDGILNNANIDNTNYASVTTLDVSGLSISNLNAITHFENLEHLDASNNLLSFFNYYDNENLLTLDLADNADLAALNVQPFDGLISLDISNCSFVDYSVQFISNCENLQVINIANNSFSILDLSDQANLTDLDVSGNDFATAGTDVSGAGSLKLPVPVEDLNTYDGSDNAGGEDVLSVESTYLNSLSISIVDSQVRVNSNEVEIQVYNFLGTRVKNENLEGVYIVRIVDKNNRIRVEKLFI